ncbi:peptidyl-prolyl cis-trans isomerase [Meridianimarinicoccus sp. RP-17]|uniref:peptidyl-prolyl cis-trans isomerase n=1 Tax=Meridianimarinicoccus zhengii TaxID=2056810 RepID=UPI000DAC87D6|nr:peptidyl-prolyl cis-trans isomerase [Phycocomes zhengii]
MAKTGDKPAAKSAKSKIGNAVVWVLLALLIVGLAGFGTGNFGGTVRSVASVGETQVSLNTYGRALQRELAARAGPEGNPMTMAEAQAQGVDTAVLQNLLSGAALEEAARMAGISVGDARVAEQIRQIPGFQGIDGQFDREAYSFALDRAGLSVSEFESQIRAELASNLLQVAAGGGVQPLPAYADAIITYLGEARTLRHVRLGEDALDAPLPDPTDAEIAAYYDANSAEFTEPGYKAITYAWLTPGMMADGIEIPEDELRAAYDARSDEYDIPARRMVERLGFPDEAAAQAAMDAIDAGEMDFDTLVTERGLELRDVDLGFVTQGDLDDAGDAVFALDDTGVVGPLPSPVGPALFRVNAILNARQVSFDEARAELRDDLARDWAEAALADRIEPLEDLLAGGATLEDLAAETDLELGRMDWRGPGDADADIASYDAVNIAAERLQDDDFPEIMQAEDGTLFALRLDETVPARVPPLDDIRDAVAAATRTAALRASLMEQAEDMATALSEGTSFADLGFEDTATTTVSRRGAPGDLPPTAIEAAFDMDRGAARVLGDDAGVVLMRLEEITPPDPQSRETQSLRQTISGQAAEAMAGQVLSVIAAAIQSEAGISVNQAAVNAVHANIP